MATYRMPTGSSAFTNRLVYGCGVFVIFLPLALLSISSPGGAQEGCFVPPALENSQTTLTLRADNQQWANGRYTGRGNVTVTYRDMRVTADLVTYDDSTHELDARGHVVFDDPKGHFEAEEGHYNVQTESGWFSKVHGYIRYSSHQPGQPATSLFVSAEKITRLDQDTYTVDGARFSSCQKPDQGLAFGVGTAKIELDHSVSGHNAVFRFLGVPILFSPYTVVYA